MLDFIAPIGNESASIALWNPDTNTTYKVDPINWHRLKELPPTWEVYLTCGKQDMTFAEGSLLEVLEKWPDNPFKLVEICVSPTVEAWRKHRGQGPVVVWTYF